MGFAQWQTNSKRGGGPNKSPDYELPNKNFNRTSSLVINAALQRQFLVTVDSRQYQSGNNYDVSIGQLNPGNHTVLIYQWKTNFLGRRFQKVLNDAAIYFRQGFETTIFINADGRASINERAINDRNDNGYGFGNSGKGMGHGYGKEKNKHKGNQQYNMDRKYCHYGNDDED